MTAKTVEASTCGRLSDSGGDAYQVLGLRPLESDLTRIHDAAQRKQRQLEARRDEVALDEWEAARRALNHAETTLLNPTDKAILDAALRRRKGNERQGHPPETDVDQIGCGQCSAANSSRRRYCSGCGASLWQSCPACNSEGPVSEQFCAICGADVVADFGRRLQRIEDGIAQAIELKTQHRYDDAHRLLWSIATSEDVRYEHHIQEAVRLLKTLERERSGHEKRAGTELERARKLFDNYAYEHASAALDDIPKHLWTQAIEELHAQVNEARKSVLQLSGDVRLSVKNGDIDSLGSQLDQLLTLKPDHKEAQQLAAKVRGLLLNKAKKGIKEHRFAEALECLDKIPRCQQDELIERQRETAVELNWITAAIKGSPVVDATLLALGTRMRRIAEGSEEIKTLCDRMAARHRNGREKKPWLAAAPWSVKSNTHLGLPVEWSGGFRRTPCEPEVRERLQQFPGCFYVGFGLALQGLEKAAVDINLVPPKKTGILGRLATRRRRPPRTSWGIDVGIASLKAVKLEFDADTEKMTISACELIEYESPLSWPGMETRRQVLTEKALKELCERHDLTRSRICVGISGHRVLGRSLVLPSAGKRRVRDLVVYEAQHQIPVPLEDLYWGYGALAARDAVAMHLQDTNEEEFTAPEVDPTRVCLLACRKFEVERLLNLFERVGLQIDVLQGDCIALHNYAVHDVLERNTTTDQGVLLVDVGSDTTNVVISTANGVWFRSVGVGGDTFLTPFVQQLSLTREQAEQVKREPQKLQRVSPVYRKLESAFRRMHEEIKRSVVSQEKDQPDLRAGNVVLLGGGAQMHGLVRYLVAGPAFSEHA